MRRATGRGLAVLATVALVACAGGCVSKKASGRTITTLAGYEVNARELRLRIYELAAQLSGTVETVTDEIRYSSPDPVVQREAIALKATVVPALQRASFHSDPLLSAVDVWLLTLQLRDWTETGEGRSRLGDSQPQIVEAMQRMVAQVERFLELQGADPDETIRDTLVDYARTHPIEGDVNTRTTAITPLAERFRDGSRMGVFAAVDSVVESLDDLSDRVAIYGSEIPKQARWQAEIALLDQGIDATLVTRAVSDLSRLAQAGDDLIAFADGVEPMIDERIEAALPQVEAALASIDLEPVRAEAEAVISTHLGVALAAVTRERMAAEAAISREREIVMGDLERMLAVVMDSSFERVEGQITAHVARLVPLGIAVLIGPFVLGLVAGMLLRRRPTG